MGIFEIFDSSDFLVFESLVYSMREAPEVEEKVQLSIYCDCARVSRPAHVKHETAAECGKCEIKSRHRHRLRRARSVM